MTVISRTAEQRGYGTYPWKYVVNMTPEERQMARDGVNVLFKAARPSGGNHGTYWRKAVLLPNGRFGPRVASEEEISAKND
jgi:hypothetical protein